MHAVPRKLLGVGIVLLVASSLPGCGGSDAPDLAKVTGTVKLDGKALPGGTVVFVPNNAEGTTGPSSTAEIGPDGSYTLMAPGGREGAVIGVHTVVVTGPPDPTNVSGESDPPPVKPGEVVKVPEKYADSLTSGVTAEVKAGENNIPVELSSN